MWQSTCLVPQSPAPDNKARLWTVHPAHSSPAVPTWLRSLTLPVATATAVPTCHLLSVLGSASVSVCVLVRVLTRSAVQTVCINKHFSPVTFSSWFQSNWTYQCDVLSPPTSSHLPSPWTCPSTSHIHRSSSWMETTHHPPIMKLCLIVLFTKREGDDVPPDMACVQREQ